MPLLAFLLHSSFLGPGFLCSLPCHPVPASRYARVAGSHSSKTLDFGQQRNGERQAVTDKYHGPYILHLTVYGSQNSRFQRSG
ncbi:hypothetical protein C8R44DRAFT_797355 [Mycena epipterygia]|nr:hypothetical protein C8R44DRAFT_797355 [Mycena epipterygia]